MESLDILNISFASNISSELEESAHSTIDIINCIPQKSLCEQQILDGLVTSFDSNDSIEYGPFSMEKSNAPITTFCKGISENSKLLEKCHKLIMITPLNL